MKNHIFQIVNSDILISISYTILFLMLLITYALILNINRFLPLLLLAFGFLLYSSLFLIDLKLNFIPFNPDINIYTQIFNNPTFYFHKEPMLALKYFAIFSKIMRPLLMQSVLNYTILHIFIFFVACINLVKTFSSFYNFKDKDSFYTFFFVIITFLPSGLLFITQPIRDAWLILGFSFFISGVFYLKDPITKILLLLNGFLISFWSRPQIFVFEFLYFLIFTFLKLKSKAVFAAIAIIGIISSAPLITKLTKVKLNASYLAYFRQENIIKHGDNLDVYGWYNWNSFLDLLIASPKLFLQFLLAPLPIVWKGDFESMRLASLDAFIILIASLVVIFYFKRVVKEQLLWATCIFLFFAIFGLVEFHITAAIRHRLPGAIMLIVLFSYLVTNTSKSNEYVVKS